MTKKEPKTVATVGPAQSVNQNMRVVLTKQFDIRLHVEVDVNDSYPSARPDFLRKCGDRILETLKGFKYAGHEISRISFYTEGMRKDDGSVTD